MNLTDLDNMQWYLGHCTMVPSYQLVEYHYIYRL
jgi:hypothetical protein